MRALVRPWRRRSRCALTSHDSAPRHIRVLFSPFGPCSAPFLSFLLSVLRLLLPVSFAFLSPPEEPACSLTRFPLRHGGVHHHHASLSGNVKTQQPVLYCTGRTYVGRSVADVYVRASAHARLCIFVHGCRHLKVKNRE